MGRPGRSQAGRRRPGWQTALLHAVVVALSALFLVPLFWLVGSSLKTDDQIRAFPPEWLPDFPFYARGSPYVDAHEVDKALRQGAGAGSRQGAVAAAWRALLLGEVTFRGAAEGAGGQTLDRLQWQRVTGTVDAGPAIEQDGQKGVLVGYGAVRNTGQIKQLALALLMYERDYRTATPAGTQPSENSPAP